MRATCRAEPQAALLAQVAGVYERRGLIADREAPPLWDCCPRSSECWRSALDARPAPAGGRAGISLPWIGPTYRLGGVAVVALNLRDAGGLFVEYEITCVTAGEASQINSMASGRRMAHGSRMAYASARSAAAIQDWASGKPIRDRHDPVDLVDALNSSVRLQAVKCSPQDGARSTPTDAMSANCPSLLLAAELEILKPRCVLTLGATAWRAIESVPGYAEEGWADRISWGRVHTYAGEYIVVALDHPAAGGLWDRGHEQLLKHLCSRSAG
jgi:uracil DNA glycosylase superfamily protein